MSPRLSTELNDPISPYAVSPSENGRTGHSVAYKIGRKEPFVEMLSHFLAPGYSH